MTNALFTLRFQSKSNSIELWIFITTFVYEPSSIAMADGGKLSFSFSGNCLKSWEE